MIQAIFNRYANNKLSEYFHLINFVSFGKRLIFGLNITIKRKYSDRLKLAHRLK